MTKEKSMIALRNSFRLILALALLTSLASLGQAKGERMACFKACEDIRAAEIAVCKPKSGRERLLCNRAAEKKMNACRKTCPK